MVEAAKITSRFQVTIPQRVRQEAAMQVGDFLIFMRTEDGWKIRIVPDGTVAALRLAGDNREFRRTLEEYHEEFETGWDDEH